MTWRGGAVGGALLIAGAGLLRAGSRPDAALPPAPPLAPPPRPTGDAALIFGINEAVAVPEAWITRGLLRPEAEAAELARDAAQAAGLGARVVRANSAVYPFLSCQALAASGFDWTQADRYFAATGAQGVDVVVVLGPWPGTRTGAYTDAYLPADMPAYEDCVRRIVERYDGDGVDDSPALVRPVLAWEADNEPDLHNSLPPQGAPGKGRPEDCATPAEDAAGLRARASAVRAAAPGATLLSGGLYRAHRPQGRAYLEAVLATPGVREALSGLSLHCYFEDQSLDAPAAVMDAAAALAPELPVWITETSVPSDERKPWVTADWQAEMVAAIYGAFLSSGAERVFWHTLADPPGGGRFLRHAEFATHSLLQTSLPDGAAAQGAIVGPGGVQSDKPAAAVYRRLAGHLAGVPREAIEEVEADGGRLLRVDNAWLADFGEPRLPADARQVEDLRTGAIADADGRARSPAWITR